MKKLFIALSLIALIAPSMAQKAPVKFGDVSLEEVKMMSYPTDSSAAAVILKDFGETKFVYSENTGFSLSFERIIRIKILTKDGVDWGSFSIPLYHENDLREKISALKATTYNFENGKVIQSKLKDDGIFKEARNANVDITKITLPNVKEGSVVEITYRIISDFLFNLQGWEFQTTIPTVSSEYWVTIPEYYAYEKYMQGYITLAVNEVKEVQNAITSTTSERTSSGGFSAVKTTMSSNTTNYKESKYKMIAQNVPAFKEEPYMTTSKDYTSKIEFELAEIRYPNEPVKPVMGSWEEMNKRYNEESDFGGEVKGNDFLKKTVQELTLSATTTEQKIFVLTSYVRDNFTWTGVSRKFTETPLRKVFDEKKGSSAELNLLLASMLEKSGIEVYPVLISTRDNGFVRETAPVSSQFNYVICVAKFDDKTLLLDATDKFLPIGTLPQRCLNGKGLIISKNGHSWIPLTSNIKSRVSVTADLKLDPEGELKGPVRLDSYGYSAQSSRRKFVTKGETDYVKEFVGSKSWQVEKSKFENTKEISEPFKEMHDLVIRDHSTSAGNVLYINPFILLRETENPFKLEKREYPVDFGSPFEIIYLGKITMPDSYIVDEIPKTKLLALPGNAGKYTYSISQVGNVLNIVSNFQINKSLYTQEEYPSLKEFYNQVVAKQAEQIVLKKK